MTELDDRELRALASIDECDLVRDLAGLVSVPSISGTESETGVLHHLAEQLRVLDLDIDLWELDLPALTAEPDFPGWEVPRGEAWGLVGSANDASEAGPPALVLQGHVDVVPPGDLAHWSGDPFVPRLEQGSVHGRGTVDMKGGVIAILAAVRALRVAGVRQRLPFAVHLVVGEEDGGLGAFGTLRRGHTGAACVIAEPTSGTVTTANAGALTFEISVEGRATHASTSYSGVSAFDAFLPVHLALAELQRSRNADVDPLMREYAVAYPLSIGRVTCGDWASSVPDRLVAEGRLGVAMDEDPALARSELEQAVSDVADRDPWLREHPPSVRWTGGQFASGRYAGDAGRLSSTVSRAHADVTGARPRERGAPYGSDLRLYAAAGITTLHYGPGDVRLAHGPDEAVPVREVVTVAEALTVTLLRTCA